MKGKKITGLILAAAVLFAGCNKMPVAEKETMPEQSIVSSETTEITNEETKETKEKERFFEFNPHVYSATIAQRIPQDYWDSFYNLCDALRAGETTFECSSVDAYFWATDAAVLCNYFPAAGAKIEPDSTMAYDNGIGRIQYDMPVDEFLVRQAQFEVLIEDIINSTIESDDTEYEKALKLYLYIADNYTYNEDHVIDGDNFVYSTFITRQGMCVNYGSVYAYLLLQAGIDAVAVGIYEETMCHSWTYAVINGNGYHFDTTWALKSCYEDVDYIYLDYFMMSDEERNSDGCLVRDLTVSVIPELNINLTSISLAAKDNSYCIRDFCNFISLDEENKTVKYCDMSNGIREFRYDV